MQQTAKECELNHHNGFRSYTMRGDFVSESADWIICLDTLAIEFLIHTAVEKDKHQSRYIAIGSMGHIVG